MAGTYPPGAPGKADPVVKPHAAAASRSPPCAATIVGSPGDGPYGARRDPKRRRDRRRRPQRAGRRRLPRAGRPLRARARAPGSRRRRRRVRAPVARGRRPPVAVLLPRLAAAVLAGRRARHPDPAAPPRDLLLYPAPGRERAAREHGRGAPRRLAGVL